MKKITNLAQLKNVFQKLRILKKNRQRACILASSLNYAYDSKAPVRQTGIKLSRKAKRTETVGEAMARKTAESQQIAEEIQTFRESYVLAMDPFDAVSFLYGQTIDVDNRNMLRTWIIRMIGEEKLILVERNIEAMRRII